tara:strand:- start:642 stop:917 length:276 start_codon:yes stop_codon:yes gene_type:complete
MPEEVKFTEEELKKIKEIQDEYIKIQNLFGQVSLTKIRLDEQYESLSKEEIENKKTFNDIQNSEKKFLEGITKKYGEGSLNPETGVFIPNK